MEQVVIVSAFRTAIGSFSGTLSTTPAHKLGSYVIKGLLSNSTLLPNEISEVILGQILTGGEGQNPARQAAIDAGLPVEVPAYTLNQVCGSGMQSIITGCCKIIASTEPYIVIAGGQENMSLSKHAIYMRQGVRMGQSKLEDMMIYDGLTDIFSGVHMGITAENIAKQYNISRNEQDEFAVASQNKAEAAQKAGNFANEIIPITVKKSKQNDIIFDQDEFIRYGANIESLQKLKPAFLQSDGTVTAGNASGINDGAAGVVLMSASEAKKRNLEPLAIVKSFAQAGVNPSIMGTGPIPASLKALHLANWKPSDLDLIESNEAFAAQAICVNREIGWDEKKVNINGGAIALGHPIGASGARILVTLIHALRKRGGGRGIATLCVGGGMGVAMCIESL